MGGSAVLRFPQPSGCILLGSPASGHPQLSADGQPSTIRQVGPGTNGECPNAVGIQRVSNRCGSEAWFSTEAYPMKLRNIRIENFRQVREWGHSFTDSLGRVRDVTLLVGPNGSGKTSILDGIAASFSPLTRINALRPGLEMSLKRIVRHGATFARVEAEVEFTPVEIEAAIAALRMIGQQIKGEEDAIRESSIVRFSWTYPDPEGTHEFGRTECEPYDAWSTFRTRSRVAHLLATQRLKTTKPLEDAGAVFTFDQQRSLFGRQIPRAIWEILATSGTIADLPPTDSAEYPSSAYRRTTDPRLLLLSMAIQDLLPPSHASVRSEPSDFDRIRDAYARICHPFSIKGPVRDEVERFDIEFRNGDIPYEYADLSSGEQMVLLILIRMVSERIHRSLLLIDEVELHEHPIWQRRILDDIRRMGVDNQIIATTHSGYLRDVIPPSNVVVLGDIGGNGRRDN
jgi:predicted ATPase